MTAWRYALCECLICNMQYVILPSFVICNIDRGHYISSTFGALGHSKKVRMPIHLNQLWTKNKKQWAKQIKNSKSRNFGWNHVIRPSG